MKNKRKCMNLTYDLFACKSLYLNKIQNKNNSKRNLHKFFNQLADNEFLLQSKMFEA